MSLTESPIHHIIHRLREKSAEGISLGDFFSETALAGHSFLILFCSLPFLQPIPLPGLSTPLGVLIATSALAQMAGRPPWIPQRWKPRHLAGPSIAKILSGAEALLQRFEKWTHPRWSPWTEKRAMRFTTGTIIIASAVLLALPLPIPLTNTFPAATIALLAVGQLERDGLLIAVGWIVFVLTAVFFGALGYGLLSGIPLR